MEVAVVWFERRELFSRGLANELFVYFCVVEEWRGVLLWTLITCIAGITGNFGLVCIGAHSSDRVLGGSNCS